MPSLIEGIPKASQSPTQQINTISLNFTTQTPPASDIIIRKWRSGDRVQNEDEIEDGNEDGNEDEYEDEVEAKDWV